MEPVKVSEIAFEFELRHTIVISELKKIGVWVPTADTPVDQDIANRIRRRLQLMVELEQEQEAKEKKSTSGRPRKTIRQLGKPRKTPGKVEGKPLESPLASSLKPRKGKASYRKVAPEVDIALERTEVTIEDEPVIEKVEAQLSAELLKKAMEQLTPIKSQELTEVSKVRGGPSVVAETKPKEAEGTPVTKEEAKPLRKRPAPVAPEQSPAPAVSLTAKGEPEKFAEVESPVEVPMPTEVPATRAAQGEATMEPREVILPETVTVKELSEKLGLKSKDILKELLNRGVMATINRSLDQKTVEEICVAFNAIPRFVSFEEAVIPETQVEDREEDLMPRAPVVTVMGHVDHGKTSILDAIRGTSVAGGEAGGITQHIGAYHVEIKDRKIVFVDTPGHEAFTLMRARGAQVTDIVVLVVAADDGVMPQTVEAIAHARAAGVPILVAINKIDKPEAQPQRVRQQLSDHELVAEDWGGDTVIIEVSATEKTNLNLLLEMILLMADIQELRANPNRPAAGVILEARLDKGRGAIATVLVQNGTLRVGDSFIAGSAYGKVRALFDDVGQPVVEAGSSSAVEVLGLQGMPQAGNNFQMVDNLAKARQVVEYRQEKLREKELSKTARVSLDELYAQIESGVIKDLPIVLKADTQGSVEVVQDTLQKLSTEKVRILVIHSGVGAISESDVLLASASQAIVIGFNVRPEQNAKAVAEHERVDILLHTVIHDVSDKIKQAMLGLLEPTVQEVFLGRGRVRETFRVPKFGTIAGTYVEDGLIGRNAEVRLVRDSVVVYEGKIDSLRRFKEDINEVKTGYECGISITNFNDIKINDVIEAFVKEKVEPRLTD